MCQDKDNKYGKHDEMEVLKADVIKLFIALQHDISYGYYKQMKRYKTLPNFEATTCAKIDMPGP